MTRIAVAGIGNRLLIFVRVNCDGRYDHLDATIPNSLADLNTDIGLNRSLGVK